MLYTITAARPVRDADDLPVRRKKKKHTRVLTFKSLISCAIVPCTGWAGDTRLRMESPFYVCRVKANKFSCFQTLLSHA